MRETLQQAAKKLLTEPDGTEKKIEINVNDGLTGLAPGTTARGVRMKTTTVRVVAAKRADGKTRTTVIALPKETLLAASDWK